MKLKLSPSSSDCVYGGLNDNSENESTVWELTASAPGYKTGTASVEVGHDGCHIKSAQAAIALVKN